MIDCAAKIQFVSNSQLFFEFCICNQSAAKIQFVSNSQHLGGRSNYTVCAAKIQFVSNSQPATEQNLFWTVKLLHI